jgi:hypothetical protein
MLISILIQAARVVYVYTGYESPVSVVGSRIVNDEGVELVASRARRAQQTPVEARASSPSNDVFRVDHGRQHWILLLPAAGFHQPHAAARARELTVKPPKQKP